LSPESEAEMGIVPMLWPFLRYSVIFLSSPALATTKSVAQDSNFKIQKIKHLKSIFIDVQASKGG